MPTDPTDDSLPDAPEPVDPSSLAGGIFEESFWRELIEGLGQLEQRVSASYADAPTDTLLELRNCVMVIQQRSAVLRERIDETFAEAIEAHGPIEVGSIRYIVGVQRSTNCTDKKTTAESLLDAVKGDLNGFCDRLVAQPFKPASVKAIIPADVYQKCFEVVEKKGIAEEPIKKLTRVDTRFVKPRTQSSEAE